MAKKESKNENKVKKHFFKDFKAELKKVIWPTPKQLVNNTVAVATIVLLTAVIVLSLDAVFDLGNKYGLTKLQSIVDEHFNNDEEKEEAHDHDHDHDHETSNEESTSTEKENAEGEKTTQENTTTENNETTVENAAQ